MLGVALGSVGYFLSERYKRSRGVTPWRVPSGMWAVLLFLLSLIGVVMYLIACFTTRPKTGPTGWAGGDPALGPGPARRRRPSSARLERTSSGPVGPGRAAGMGRAGSRRMGGATARLQRSATTGRLGRSSASGKGLSPAGTAGRARRRPQDRRRPCRCRHLLRGRGCRIPVDAMSCVTGMEPSSPSTWPTAGRSAPTRSDTSRRERGRQPLCSGGYWGPLDFRVLSRVIRWAKGVPAISRRQSSRTAEPETSPTRGPRWSPGRLRSPRGRQ